jgi:outer membrane protein assembly factor BamB
MKSTFAMIRFFRPTAAALMTLCFIPGLVAQESGQSRWPQWRGTNLDNRSDASDVPVEFSREKNMLWAMELPGPGGASPIVWDEHVFVTTIDSEEAIWLFCVGTDGAEKWRKRLQGESRTVMDGGNAASPSPSTDGKHVWAPSAAGFIECFDLAGNPVWTADLQKQFGEFDIQFGWTSTPVLHEGRLYLQMIHGNMRDKSPSKGIVACLDALTGKELWRVERKTGATVENKHSYTSPVVFQIGDDKALLTHGADYVIAHSLEDGSELWRCGGLNPLENYNPLLRFVSSPVFADGQIVVPSAKNGPVYSLDPQGLSGDVTDEKSSFKWRIDKGTPDVATPLVDGGLVYLARENGAMLCIDTTTGEEVYSERLLADKHRSTPVLAEGRLYLCGRDGTVLVLKAGREPEVLARNELGEPITASPAVTDGRIYIRSSTTLYCFGS